MDDCPHPHPELHSVGDSVVIACGQCLVVLDRDLPMFLK